MADGYDDALPLQVPVPRNVIPVAIVMGRSARWTENAPAPSCTTSPAGHELIAFWMSV